MICNQLECFIYEERRHQELLCKECHILRTRAGCRHVICTTALLMTLHIIEYNPLNLMACKQYWKQLAQEYTLNTRGHHVSHNQRWGVPSAAWDASIQDIGGRQLHLYEVALLSITVRIVSLPIVLCAHLKFIWRILPTRYVIISFIWKYDLRFLILQAILTLIRSRPLISLGFWTPICFGFVQEGRIKTASVGTLVQFEFLRISIIFRKGVRPQLSRLW